MFNFFGVCVCVETSAHHVLLFENAFYESHMSFSFLFRAGNLVLESKDVCWPKMFVKILKFPIALVYLETMID